MLVAKADVDLLVFVDAQTETVHGVSVRWRDGERVRVEFLRWAFSSGAETHEVRLGSGGERGLELSR